MVKIRFIMLLVLILFYINCFAGFVDTPQTIRIEQPKANVYLEFGKWVGGIGTVSFAAWLTWHLNNKKKKND